MRNNLIALFLVAQLWWPVFAQATTTKDPLSYPIKTYGLMLCIAVLGGVVSFYAKVRRGEVAAVSIMHLVGEITTSAFAGLLTFWLCEYFNAPQLLTAPLVGVAGHMGAKAIGLIEDEAKRRFVRKAAGE